MPVLRDLLNYKHLEFYELLLIQGQLLLSWSFCPTVLLGLYSFFIDLFAIKRNG